MPPIMRAKPILVSILLSLVGCSAPPPKRPPRDELVPLGPEWSASALWLHATAGIAAGHKSECQGVAAVLEKEKRCKKQLCKNGADLANEWIDKCKKIDSAELAAVTELAAALADEADRGKTPCSKELAAMMESCSEKDCREQAQHWATECGDNEAGPLAVAMLERTVERGAGEPVHLDARGCNSMRDEIREGARCADEPACRAAWKTVLAQRKRCVTEGAVVDLSLALWEATIVHRGAIEAEPIVAKMDEIDLEGVVLPFADQHGSVIEVCRERPADLAAYRKARDACQGTMTVARRGDDGHILVGRVALPPPGPFAALYPTLMLVGEAAALEAESAAAVKKDLDEVAAASPEAALGLLAKAFDRHAAELERYKAAAQELIGHDAALAPLFARIGQAKTAAHVGIKQTALRRAFADRAANRPFADLTLEGVVEPGAETRAYFATPFEVLPESGKAYRRAILKLQTLESKSPRPGPAEAQKARKTADAGAASCQQARDRSRAARDGLLACALEAACDGARTTALGDEWTAAHAEVLRLRREIDTALSVLPPARSRLRADVICPDE
jgi:hypothetical protein